MKLYFLVAFNILSLIFAILITTCLGIILYELILFGTLCAFWTCMSVSFPRLGRFYLLYPLILSLFSLGDTYISNVSMLDIVPKISCKLSSFILISYFFLHSVSVISITLSYSSLICPSISFNLL